MTGATKNRVKTRVYSREAQLTYTKLYTSNFISIQIYEILLDMLASQKLATTKTEMILIKGKEIKTTMVTYVQGV